MNTLFRAVRENNVDLISATVNSHFTNYSSAPVNGNSMQKKPRRRQEVLDLNKPSLFGRTILHFAASLNRVEIVQTLIACSSININVQDKENGWTALHRALYEGNIGIALILLTREDIDLYLKDHEGNTAFDLLNSTIDDTSPLSNCTAGETNYKGDVLFTWGSNANYVLGQPDSDNRTHPERIELATPSQQTPFIFTRPKVCIGQIAMSKYHTAAVTDEEQDNLFLCGFGNGGRLGYGTDTQLKLKSVPGLGGNACSMVALGRDHTIVVTNSGYVFTFGSNRFGQLGYETITRKDEEPVQLTPRKVVHGLRREKALGAAASRCHTCVWTEIDVFTFGLNQGQLGYQKAGTDIQCFPRKITMVPFGSRIQHVVATDHATALLLESHDVIVLNEFNYRKIIFNTQHFPSGMTISATAPVYITKLLAGGDDYLGALTNQGELFLWSTFPQHQQQHNQKGPRTLPISPTRIWTHRRAHHNLFDAAIGQGGRVIVCTVSGHVFVGSPRQVTKHEQNMIAPKFYKFAKITGLQRVISVAANSSGAFAIIRKEAELKEIVISDAILGRDLRRTLPQYEDEGTNEQATSDTDSATSIYEEEAEKNQKVELKHLHGILAQNFSSLLQRWDELFSRAENDRRLDVVFLVEKRRVYAHRIILAARSPFFYALFRDEEIRREGEHRTGCFIIRWREHVSFPGTQRAEIEVDGVGLRAFCSCIDYIYMDKYVHPKDPSFSFSRRGSRLESDIVQAELKLLAGQLDLPELLNSASSNFVLQPTPTLGSHLSAVIEVENLYDFLADVILELEDRIVPAHEVILKSRSPFFEAMFGSGDAWVMHRRDAGGDNEPKRIVVNLRHLSWGVMRIVLKYIYGDFGLELFNDVEEESTDNLVDLITDVMAAANELLLSRLKEICEEALRKFVTLRNVASILEISCLYKADQLKAACLDWLCVNMETTLENRLLDGFSEDIIESIEEEMHAKQLKKRPLTRSHTLFESGNLLDTEDDEFIDQTMPDDFVYEVTGPNLTSTSVNSTRTLSSIGTHDENGDRELEDPDRGDRASTPDSTHELIFDMDDHHGLSVTSESKAKEKGTSSNIFLNMTQKQEILSLQNIPNADSMSEAQSSLLAARPIAVPSDQTSPNINYPGGRSGSSSRAGGWKISTTAGGSADSPKLSLREILESEARQSRSKVQKISSSPSPTTHVSDQAFPMNLKLVHKSSISQKERKKISADHIEQSLVVNPKPAWTSPWNQIGSPSSSISYPLQKKSLLDIQIETREKTNSETASAIRRPVIVDIPTNAHQQATLPSTSTYRITPMKLINRSPKTAEGLKSIAPFSFAAIQQQQQREAAALRGAKAKKSLLRIQTEEKAIEGLMEFYLQTADEGEWFSIERA